MLIGALAEREEFADDWIFGTRSNGLNERINDMAAFKAITSEADLLAFATKNKVGWYLLRPESMVHWPEYFREKSVFDCAGYRVYRFPIWAH